MSPLLGSAERSRGHPGDGNRRERAATLARMQTTERTWWARPGLEVREGRLAIAGRDAERLAREHGTPIYVHDLVSAREQAERLRDAMDGAGLRYRDPPGAEGPA